LVVVREDEPSSIIAYSLASDDYNKNLEQIKEAQALYNPLGDSVLSSSSNQSLRSTIVPDIEEVLRSASETHISHQFYGPNTKFVCKIFFAEQFDALRRHCGCQDTFIDSLSTCIKWEAIGGKSGSVFLKTKDDRLIMKGLSKAEMDAFLKFAPAYFEYMSRAFFHGLSTILAKIFGFYRIGYRNTVTGRQMSMDVLVMENLFYDQTITKMFDLKGSIRNRHIAATGKETDVLLDENLLEHINASPIYIREHDKAILRTTIWNDTLFLSKLNVMDYSLLVGMDKVNNRLVVGIVGTRY
jgi:1-phosphatidylinositol-3-phosphate 5-kinase